MEKVSWFLFPKFKRLIFSNILTLSCSIAFLGLNSFSLAQTFNTVWKSDNPGSSSDSQITIPTTGTDYDYNVTWSEVGNAANSGSLSNVTGNVTIDFPTPGEYIIEIDGAFPRIYFNGGGDRRKILSVEQWGNNPWQSMQRAFRGCSNLVINAVDAPDLSNVIDMSQMFRGATSFNQPIGTWDVSNVTNMALMFESASTFNQDIGGWDVSNVTNMASMFERASAFNQNIGSWDVGMVMDMERMFRVATVFNQNINNWNVGNVTDMNLMFSFSNAFNQPLDNWNTGSVTNMSGMFDPAQSFNQNINSWDVSSVTDMSAMFGAFVFNQPLDNWDVSSVQNMSGMFDGANEFNQDLNSWDVSSVTNMRSMFERARAFNGAIGNWNVVSVTRMNDMFRNASAFNQPIDSWDVSNVTNMAGMFSFASAFNQPLGSWNVSAVTTMDRMFNWATSFNQNLNTWDVSSVRDMGSLFGSASAFNQPLDNWNVINVSSMDGMFTSTPFDQDISMWDVSNVNNIARMFQRANSFNQDISGWNVSNVQFMQSMFNDADSFNQPIGSWDVSNVINMGATFLRAAAFDQDISAWDIGNVQSASGMLSESGLSTENYDNALIAWAALPALQSDITLDAVDISYCTAETERNSIIANYNWTINDAGLKCPSGKITVFEGDNTTGPQIMDGQTEPIDYGIGVSGSNILRHVTIENLGPLDLNISNISITGSAFFLGSTPPSLVPVGNPVTIDIFLNGMTIGAFTETVTIFSDDADTPEFDFQITGEVRATAESEIVVYEGNDTSGPEIIDGQTMPLDFGAIPAGTAAASREITIENKGLADLDIATISITGSVFFISATPPSTIAPGMTEVIEIFMDETTEGSFNETLTIENNDVDEGVFNFLLTGRVSPPPSPEIAISFEGIDITDGQTTAIDIGSSPIGMSLAKSFDMFNSGGSADLIISDITVDNAAFSVTPGFPTTIGVDESDTFQFEIVLSGMAEGTFMATVTILNNDIDEATFDFPITGTIVGSNSSPTITTIDDVVIDEDNDTSEIPFTIGDAETSADMLTVTATSDNQLLVPDSRITLGGSGSSRNIVISPLPNVSGTAVITVVVSDGITSSSEQFVVTVTAVNDIPMITDQSSLSTNQNEPVTISLDDFTILDPDNTFPDDFALTINAGSDYTASGTTITPATDFVGSLTFPITVSDGIDSSPVFNATIEVLQVDQDQITVVVDGQSQVSGGSIQFNDALVGSREVEEITLSNSGTSTLVISSITIEGDDFSLVSPIPDPIPVGGSTILEISFSPSSIGTKTAVLRIISDASEEFTSTLSASGLNEIPDIEVFNAVTVQSNDKHDFLEIRNIELYESNRVFIYSRWGLEVFKTVDYNNTTNRFIGNSDGGKELPSGTYYYVIELNDGKIIKNGYFLLRR